ncbi:MAG TPA: EutN/CcmL family microcompartment protein [bacterium]|nr:EutN/CcmL family microcompartment protein [Candidatus Omnitrophota bacterium]HOJ59592.1 EutN/CcmL family microcompartment protein [bacterium]HOL94221.1 EutN/CcmL family microcompartment protein [bacterium]HPP01319.1 EutN/CcmL family microcompartment protein [bacterium]HXK94245.1 EutN/CcmL family microcompartment protein [bacterium]
MFLAKVVGTVVATQKDPKLAGLKLLLVQNLTLDLELTKSFVVAADAVGAGTGEVVVCATGSSARLTEVTHNLPVDAVIMAIVDSLEVGGRITYNKMNDEKPVAAGPVS